MPGKLLADSEADHQILNQHAAKGLEDQAMEADVLRKTRAAKKRAAKRNQGKGAASPVKRKGRSRKAEEVEEEEEEDVAMAEEEEEEDEDEESQITRLRAEEEEAERKAERQREREEEKANGVGKKRAPPPKREPFAQPWMFARDLADTFYRWKKEGGG